VNIAHCQPIGLASQKEMFQISEQLKSLVGKKPDNVFPILEPFEVNSTYIQSKKFEFAFFVSLEYLAIKNL
jgi:hypothetical protein